MQKLMFVGAWIVGTAIAIAVATAAVGLVRNEVTDGPRVTQPTLAAPTSTSSTVAPSSPTSSSTSAPPASTTTVPPSTTTTTTGSTTTVPSISSTTTTPAPTTTVGAVTRTYSLIGGTVTISAADPRVMLVAAVPTAGFSVEIKNDGPDTVEIEFDAEDHESEFKARWDGGELIVDIDESD